MGSAHDLQVVVGEPDRRRSRWSSARRSTHRRWSGPPTAASARAPPSESAARPSSACRPWADAICGPSCRITWPIWNSRSLRISHGPNDEADGERREARRRGAKRDVARHVQHRQLRVERVEEVIQHQPRSAFSRSTTRSVLTPRDPFTSTTSPAGGERDGGVSGLVAGGEVPHVGRRHPRGDRRVGQRDRRVAADDEQQSTPALARPRGRRPRAAPPTRRRARASRR